MSAIIGEVWVDGSGVYRAIIAARSVDGQTFATFGGAGESLYPPDGWARAGALPVVPDPELVGDGGGV